MHLVYTIFYFSDNTNVREFHPNYEIAYKLAQYEERYKNAYIVYSEACYSSEHSSFNPNIHKRVYRNTNHDEIPLRIAQGMLLILN